MTENRSICVYCGSQPGRIAAYQDAARGLGRDLVENRIRLVYGGGTTGIMGVIAEEVTRLGGAVTGIIPEFLLDIEAANGNKLDLDELIVTEDMHARKHAMFDRSGAFVAMPGGIGTLEEIVEIMTWAQLGRHRRPMVLANIGGFWDPLLEMLAHTEAEGFLHSRHLVQPLVIDAADRIVPAILRAWDSTTADAGVSGIIEKM